VFFGLAQFYSPFDNLLHFTTWYSLHTTNSMHRTRNICVLNAHSSRSATAIIRDAIAFSLQCQVELNICNGRTIHLTAINQRHHRPPPFILSPSGYVHTPASSVSSAFPTAPQMLAVSENDRLRNLTHPLVMYIPPHHLYHQYL
jgi:hypothetical protein